MPNTVTVHIEHATSDGPTWSTFVVPTDDTLTPAEALDAVTEHIDRFYASGADLNFFNDTSHTRIPIEHVSQITLELGEGVPAVTV